MLFLKNKFVVLFLLIILLSVLHCNEGCEDVSTSCGIVLKINACNNIYYSTHCCKTCEGATNGTASVIPPRPSTTPTPSTIPTAVLGKLGELYKEIVAFSTEEFSKVIMEKEETIKKQNDEIAQLKRRIEERESLIIDIVQCSQQTVSYGLHKIFETCILLKPPNVDPAAYLNPNRNHFLQSVLLKPHKPIPQKTEPPSAPKTYTVVLQKRNMQRGNEAEEVTDGVDAYSS